MHDIQKEMDRLREMNISNKAFGMLLLNGRFIDKNISSIILESVSECLEVK